MLQFIILQLESLIHFCKHHFWVLHTLQRVRNTRQCLNRKQGLIVMLLKIKLATHGLVDVCMTVKTSFWLQHFSGLQCKYCIEANFKQFSLQSKNTRGHSGQSRCHYEHLCVPRPTQCYRVYWEHWSAAGYNNGLFKHHRYIKRRKLLPLLSHSPQWHRNSSSILASCDW